MNIEKKALMTPEEQIKDLFYKKGCLVTGTRIYPGNGFKEFNLLCKVPNSLPNSLPIKTYWTGFKLDYKIEDMIFTTGNTQTSPLIDASSVNITSGNFDVKYDRKFGKEYHDYKQLN